MQPSYISYQEAHDIMDKNMCVHNKECWERLEITRIQYVDNKLLRAKKLLWGRMFFPNGMNIQLVSQEVKENPDKLWSMPYVGGYKWGKKYNTRINPRANAPNADPSWRDICINKNDLTE